jgi:hypothetical protein
LTPNGLASMADFIGICGGACGVMFRSFISFWFAESVVHVEHL